MLDLDADNSPYPPVPGESQINLNSHGTAEDDLLTIERHLSHGTQPPQSEPLNSGVGAEKVAYYIQVIERDTEPVIRTNLPRTDATRPTEQGVAWLLGRSRNCTIVFPDPAVSRCHAVLSYQPDKGLQLTDVGSSNGTFINGKRLVAMAAHAVHDRDVITISHIGVKLFVLTETAETSTTQ